MTKHSRGERTAENGGSRLAVVFSGGGSKGALQVGLYRAMVDMGLRADLVLGASVGALNAAFVAAAVGPDVLAAGWADLSFRRLFGFNWRILLRGSAAASLFSSARLRRIVCDGLPVQRFDELPTPLTVITTHMGLGEACVWERGNIADAVVTSCAIPGLLPPVFAHDGIPHIDGSLADNLPIDLARERGATHVIAMHCRTCAACVPRATHLRDVLGAAFGIAADCRLRMMENRYRADPNVLLLQPELGEAVATLDFSQGERLVQQGYDYAAPRLEEWLAHQPTLRSR